jgi:glycosyltransferase involved in cell wall biosynthesis
MRFLERAVTLNADAIVVAADSYANELIMNGVQENKVHTVPFYIEDEFFQQPIESNLKGPFTFCYVGGFHPYHILTPVIEAFEQLSKKNDNIGLSLVGEGPLRSHIENEVARRKLTQKIKFIGRLPHESLPKFLSRVDSFIVLMHKPGISTSLLEAAAAGKAIITLKRRDDLTLERYFRHRKEILYVEDTSPHKIAEAMELISEDSKVRNTLSVGARKAAKQNFSEEVCLSQLQTLMQETLDDHPRSETAIQIS